VKAIWTIARRELKTMFDQPMGYILLVVFLVINDFLFFRQIYLYRVASLRPMLDLLPWMFLFFVPAVTMRSFAEDIRTGTLEVVLSQPITEVQLLLGKYLGQTLFVWFALALTLPIPIGLSLGADLHSGVIFAQYVGAALLAASFTAVGVWTSNLTKHQITAFVIGVAVMFLLILIGLDPVLVGLPPALNSIAARLGVISHFRDIARGVIDLRDAIYFITLTAIFLSLAYLALLGLKLSHKGEALRRLRTATALVVVGLVIVNLFGRHIRGRLDLTPGRAYTLSSATRDLVGDLNDIVTLKLFVSNELPPEVAMLQRDLDDLLRDYRNAGNEMLRVVVQDPSSDSTAADDARSLGIPPVQFNVVGESELTVREGYLGIAIQHADESETIPFVRQTADLEYRLSSFIRGMTREDRPTVGLYEAPPPQQASGQPGPTYNAFRQALQQTYDVRTLRFPADSQPDDEIDVLVLIDAPETLPADQMDRLRGFLDRGGSALILGHGMQPPGQQEFVLPREVLWNDLLVPYGVSIQSDMVYDLLSNEQAQVPTQFGMMIAPYPLWVRGISTRSAPVNADLETLFMPWTSSLDTTAAVPGTVTPLFVTSEAAGIDSMMSMLAPRRQFQQVGLEERLLAAMVNPGAAEEAAGTRGRMVVAGNTNMLRDNFLGGNPANIAFGLNAVDWLAQDEALIGIRAKNRTPPPLVFSSNTLRDFVKHGNVIGVPILLVILAVLRLVKRNQLTQRKYQRGSVPEGAA
jgi:ABC-type uncharacterized transport system involved in gliding motility auxiliary subunit/ABC-type transport system involved in multi-copper enzyme maturation permease subunit